VPDAEKVTAAIPTAAARITLFLLILLGITLLCRSTAPRGQVPTASRIADRVIGGWTKKGDKLSFSAGIGLRILFARGRTYTYAMRLVKVTLVLRPVLNYKGARDE